MIAIATLVLVAILSTALGYCLAARPITSFEPAWFAESPWLRVTLIAVMTGLLCIGQMILIGVLFPAINDPQFRRSVNFGIAEDQIDIQIAQVCNNVSTGPETNLICTNVPRETVVNTISANIKFPAKVPVRIDFPIILTLSSKPRTLPVETYSATLYLPSFVEGRSS